MTQPRYRLITWACHRQDIGFTQQFPPPRQTPNTQHDPGNQTHDIDSDTTSQNEVFTIMPKVVADNAIQVQLYYLTNPIKQAPYSTMTLNRVIHGPSPRPRHRQDVEITQQSFIKRRAYTNILHCLRHILTTLNKRTLTFSLLPMKIKKVFLLYDIDFEKK